MFIGVALRVAQLCFGENDLRGHKHVDAAAHYGEVPRIVRFVIPRVHLYETESETESIFLSLELLVQLFVLVHDDGGLELLGVRSREQFCKLNGTVNGHTSEDEDGHKGAEPGAEGTVTAIVDVNLLSVDVAVLEDLGKSCGRHFPLN